MCSIQVLSPSEGRSFHHKSGKRNLGEMAKKGTKEILMGLISVSVSRPGIEQRFDGFPLRMREGKQTSLGFPKLEKTLSTQLYHGLFSKRSSSVAYQSLFYPMIDLLMTIRSRAASSIYVPNCIHFKKCTGHSEKGSLSPNARHLAQN